MAAAAKKFLTLTGLEQVAEKVNKKLRVVTSMPLNPEIDDIVIYNGATTADFTQGSIYIYKLVRTYYEWNDLSTNYYTLSPSPAVGDIAYSDFGITSGYTIEAYDAIQNQVTINNLTYDRNSAGDTDIYDWVCQDTVITLNGEEKTREVSIYAPTSAGTEGQVLVSKGNEEEPEWTSLTGYAPSFVDEALVFSFGTIPEVEDNALILNI